MSHLSTFPSSISAISSRIAIRVLQKRSSSACKLAHSDLKLSRYMLDPLSLLAQGLHTDQVAVLTTRHAKLLIRKVGTMSKEI